MDFDGKSKKKQKKRNNNKFKKGLSPKKLSEENLDNNIVDEGDESGNIEVQQHSTEKNCADSKKANKKMSLKDGSFGKTNEVNNLFKKLNKLSKKKNKKGLCGNDSSVGEEENEITASSELPDEKLFGKKQNYKKNRKADNASMKSKSMISGTIGGEMEDELDLSMENKNLDANLGFQGKKSKFNKREHSPKKVKVTKTETDGGTSDEHLSHETSEDKPADSKNIGPLSKISHFMQRKRKREESPENLDNGTGLVKSQDFIRTMSKPTKLSKQAKKMKKELPGLEEPELTKYSQNMVSFTSDKIEEESSDGFSESSDEISDEENKTEGESLLGELKRDSPEKLRRTVFVGNIPVSMSHKDLTKFFSAKGKVETVRFRSSVPKKLSIPRKVADIKHEFNDAVTSLKGFVVFQNRAGAEAALELNGTIVKGHHIRVDRAVRKEGFDDKQSVFVGNLPFQVDDESLWEVFSKFGPIRNVRVIRNNATGIGKGFGYVQFENAASVDAAVEAENLEINGRELRVKRSTFTQMNQKKNTQFKKNIQSGGKYWEPIGNEMASKSTVGNPQKRKFGFRKFHKRDENITSRKTSKKLMNKKRRDQQKKKISSLFDKK